MRIWYVLTVVVIAAVLVAGEAAFSQGTTGSAGAPADDAVEPADSSADQADRQDEPATQPSRKPQGPAGLGKWFLPMMIGGMILLWFWMGRGRRKQQQRRKEMLEVLKKGDKVTTVGGVVGTVIEVKTDEVTVKVDESSNVRMKFARWAIRGIGETGKVENPDQESGKP